MVCEASTDRGTVSASLRDGVCRMRVSRPQVVFVLPATQTEGREENFSPGQEPMVP